MDLICFFSLSVIFQTHVFLCTLKNSLRVLAERRQQPERREWPEFASYLFVRTAMIANYHNDGVTLRPFLAA